MSAVRWSRRQSGAMMTMRRRGGGAAAGRGGARGAVRCARDDTLRHTPPRAVPLDTAALEDVVTCGIKSR